MMKAGGIFSVVVVLALASFSAGAYDVTENTQDYQWQAADWQVLDGTKTLVLDLDWSRGSGESNAWSVWGYMADDPAVSEKIRNRTPDLWTDWHVIVHNGIIDQNTARVYRYLPAGLNWLLAFSSGTDWTSLTAIAPDPGQTVAKNQFLSVYFVFTPMDPNLPVKIDEWPTKDWVPEPSSIAAMAMGLVAMGFSLRRRIR